MTVGSTDSAVEGDRIMELSVDDIVDRLGTIPVTDEDCSFGVSSVDVSEVDIGTGIVVDAIMPVLIEAGELLSATGTCDEVDVVDESTIWPGELTPSVDVAEETIILALGSVPPLLC